MAGRGMSRGLGTGPVLLVVPGAGRLRTRARLAAGQPDHQHRAQPWLRRTLCSALPPARQAEVLRAWDIAVVRTGGYLYFRALMALISGIAHYIVFQVLGVPYAPALAVWVGLVSQFIPTVGTYLAGALPILIAFTENPWDALWVLCLVVVYQQFENYLPQPRITARTVDIHPAVVFGSVLTGTALLGAVGALIAIPVTATP
jgi:predicted PurR-regulated permease PerM